MVIGLRMAPIQGNEDGEGQQGPEAAGHGVDPLLLIELGNLLLILLLISRIFLLQLLELGGKAAHVHHAALALHLEGQQHQLDNQGEENNGKAIVSHQIVKQHHDAPKGLAIASSMTYSLPYPGPQGTGS